LPHHQGQDDGFENHGGGGPEGRTPDTVDGNEYRIQQQADGERQSVDRRRGGLLAGHRQERLGRSDRGAGEDAGDHDEENGETVVEAGAEQAEERPADDEDADRHGDRGPEGPLHRGVDEGGEFVARVGVPERGEALRRADLGGVVDEVDEGERLHRGEVDGDPVGLGEAADEQDVDAVEQHQEAVDQEHRGAEPHPGADVPAPRRLGHGGGEAAAEEEGLDEGGRPGGDHRRPAGLDRGRLQPEHDGAGHHRQDHRRAGDEGRQEGEIGPALGDGDAVLDLGDGVDRQADGGDEDRHQPVVGDEIGPEPQHGAAEAGDQRRDREGPEPGGEDEAAGGAVVAVVGVFAQEGDHRLLEAEGEDDAEGDHQCPQDDEDAVFEAAHPAGEQHLADIGEAGGEHPHQEGGDRHAPGGRRGVVVERRAAAEDVGQAGGDGWRKPSLDQRSR